MRATEEHVTSLLKNAREADRREWEDALAVPLEESLYPVAVPGNPYNARAAVAGDTTLCIWGTASYMDLDLYGPPAEAMNVWLIASKEAYRYVLSCHRLLDAEMENLHRHAKTLVAQADDRNFIHQRWLRRIGFVQGPTTFIGPNRLPYTTFTRRKP